VFVWIVFVGCKESKETKLGRAKLKADKKKSQLTNVSGEHFWKILEKTVLR